MMTPDLDRQRLPISQVVCVAPTGGDVFDKDQPAMKFRPNSLPNEMKLYIYIYTYMYI